jgi:NADH-quinone oxidoreductase subunit N
MVNYSQLTLALLPELIVLIGILVILFVDLASREKSIIQRARTAAIFPSVFLIFSAIALYSQSDYGILANGMLVVNPLNRIAKGGVIVLAIFTAWISSRSDFTNHIGEYFAMVLLSTIGLMLMCGTFDLLVAFLSLELASLSLYILTAFNKTNRHSAEAAMKYFLFGSTAAAFTLFGLSFIYGLAGGTSFEEIRAALAVSSSSGALLLGITMVVIGFGFKVAIVPFHLWAPDAYQGAPIPSAAFIGSASKVASFVLFAGLFFFALNSSSGSFASIPFQAGWKPILAVLALLSMIFGNVLAIAQTNFRRLLAYSAVAHGGYTLLGFIGKTGPGFSAVIFYALTYGLTIVGLFAIGGLIERKPGQLQIIDFAGFAQREPLLGICLMVLMLSLAGIPPLAGFFGKFYLFTAALVPVGGRLENLWLVIVAIAASAVSLYYYLQVLKQAYVLPGAEDFAAIPSSAKAPIVLLAALVLLLGCFPHLLLRPLTSKPSMPPRQPLTDLFHKGDK